jgi:hypothetical protein
VAGGGVREGGGCRMGGEPRGGARVWGKEGAPLYMWSSLLGHGPSCQHMGRISPTDFVLGWADTMG